MNLTTRSRARAGEGMHSVPYDGDVAAHEHLVEFDDSEGYLVGTVAGFAGPGQPEAAGRRVVTSSIGTSTASVEDCTNAVTVQRPSSDRALPEPRQWESGSRVNVTVGAPRSGRSSSWNRRVRDSAATG